MKTQNSKLKTQNYGKGFTLIETLIGSALFVIIASAIYLSYSNILDIVIASQINLSAQSALSREVEIIKNIKYDDVGIQGGSPEGILQAQKNITIDGIPFILNTFVRNIDDPFDGTIGGAPNDTAPADYKLVELELTCPSCASFVPARITTTVAPKNLENTTNNGALFINVFDAFGVGVSGADISIVNNQTNPTININDITNTNGKLQLVDIATSSADYEIMVSKSGYSSEQTYPIGGAGNPNPTKPHSTVASGLITNISFAIDKVSSIDFRARDKMCKTPAQSSSLPWYHPSWLNRDKISIDGTKVIEDLQDFPVLISLTSIGLRDNAQADNDDILFTSSNGTTKLSHEIEKFNNATGELVAWVNVPSLLSGVDTVIYMYYGNATAQNQEDIINTWDASYAGVWHLGDDPIGPAPQFNDSTTNANNGTLVGALSSSISGQVGSAYDFNGIDSGINVGSGDSIDDLGPMTVSAWINPRTIGENAIGQIASKDNNSVGAWFFELDDTGGEDMALDFGKDYDGSSNLDHASNDNVIDFDTWQYIVVTWDGSSLATNVHFYKNGIETGYGYTSNGSGPLVSDSLLDLTIGNDTTSDKTFDGFLDELRISNVVRSLGWIRTAYNNQSSPSTFLSVEAGVGDEDMDFSITGTKLIGASPDVLKYPTTNFNTDVYGDADINDLEFDTYNVQNIDNDYEISGQSEPSALVVNPDTIYQVTWVVEPKDPRALLVNVKDNTGSPINDASIRLSKSGYDETNFSGRNSIENIDWSGGQYDSKSAYLDVDTIPGQLQIGLNAGKYASMSDEWLISNTIDMGTSNTAFYNIYWNPVSQPAQTTLKLQIATNNDNLTWNFIGPDGTSGTFYTVSDTQIHASHDSNQYIRYKAILRTQDQDATPTLEDISFEFSSLCLIDGQAYFDGLGSGTYTLTVTKSGYQDFIDGNLGISDSWLKYNVTLNP